jgi:MtaA/CmuA family methyltransferase
MTGRERVLNALRGQPTDCLPFMPITMMFAADSAGVKYGDYARDRRVLAYAQVFTARKYNIDHVSAISDPAREAADLGADIEWFDDQPPAIVESRALLQDKAALSNLGIPDFTKTGRMQDRIEGVRLLRETSGADRAVEGWVEGPCALAADLRGVNTLMLDFIDDPEFVERLFAFVVGMEIEFAKAQIEAGADFIGIGDAAASLVGLRIYEQFVLPWEQKLIGAIRAAGAPVRLHICGNTRKIVGGMAKTGAEMIDLDYPTPMGEARAAIAPPAILSGNLDPVRAVRDGNPDSIRAALTECRAQAGARYIVCAGCEITRGTPEANLRAMEEFARTA